MRGLVIVFVLLAFNLNAQIIQLNGLQDTVKITEKGQMWELVIPYSNTDIDFAEKATEYLEENEPVVERYIARILLQDTDKDKEEDKEIVKDDLLFKEIERQIDKPNAVSTISKFKKDLLIKYAKYKGVSSEGTKKEIIERLIRENEKR